MDSCWLENFYQNSQCGHSARFIDMLRTHVLRGFQSIHIHDKVGNRVKFVSLGAQGHNFYPKFIKLLVGCYFLTLSLNPLYL